MDVTEQIEEQRTADAPLAEVSAPEVSSLPEAAPVQPAWIVPNRAWLRMAYIFEFWIALLAIFTVWSQVGGQGHLDLIAWYIKLVCAVSLAWASVKMTRGAMENARAWNRTTVRWLFAVLAISVLMAGITYWYHLHEVTDEPDTDENTATTAAGMPAAQNSIWDLIARDREYC